MTALLTMDEIVRIMRESGALDTLDINEDDVRDGHHRVGEVLPSMELAYAAGISRGLRMAREDYLVLSAWLEAISDRLRAAILDVIEESGAQSPEHLRLRYALTGAGRGAPTQASREFVAGHSKNPGVA